MGSYVGMSGSPMPRLITSIPAARLACTLRSSSANRYGWICSSRLLDRTKILHELRGHPAREHRQRPAGEPDVQILPHLDLELTTVQHHGDGRIAAPEDVGDRGAGGAGAARLGLPHPAFEYSRPDSARRQHGVPGDVGPIGELVAVLDLRSDRRQVEALEL